ncbi:MAG TPA: TlyA family RNA methyltransferase [Acidimicrobiales bacterium]|nr:TlyA family RNA methyltransferase [Acidimicrobiales bacterium]
MQVDCQACSGQEIDQEGRFLSHPTRRRLDAELVRRGLSPTRDRARATIAAGQVLVAGALAAKPARLVSAAEPIEVQGSPPPFVSRGGEKLDAALDRFGIVVSGVRALDAGSSTGGFVDCLLTRGAAEVVAVDVGRGQLHERLRRDPRVVVLERTNVRQLGLDHVGGAPFALVVADLSFISLRTVAPVLLGELAAPDADVVALVKPQFEAGRAEASRGKGVVKDPRVWERVLVEICSAFRGAGAAMMEAMVSPLTGARGNVEFLVHARAHARTVEAEVGLDLTVVVAEATALGGR